MNTPVEKAAASILHRAIDLDNKNRYTEALTCYLEALNILININKETKDEEKKKYLRTKMETYMSRAEVLKKHIETEKGKGTYHEQLSIENNSVGHGYDSVFGRFLDSEVTSITVEDPYVRAFHQCQNFLCACELFVKKCENLKTIDLLTSEEPKTDQRNWLEQLKCNLANKHNIALRVRYSETLHDRQIMLSNGWIIKIGRGLDYFKAVDNKFSLGAHDLDLRACHETSVDIFHRKAVQAK